MSPPLPPFPSLAQRFRWGGRRSLIPRRSPLGSSRPLGWATQSMPPVSLPFRAPLGAQSALSPIGLFQNQEFAALPDVEMPERSSQRASAVPADATDTPSAPPQTLPATASTDDSGDGAPAPSPDIQPKVETHNSPGSSSTAVSSPLSPEQPVSRANQPDFSSQPLQPSPASDGAVQKVQRNLEPEILGSDRPPQPITSDSPAPIQRQPKSSATIPSDQPEASPLEAEQSTASTKGESPAIQRQVAEKAEAVTPISEPLQDRNSPSASTVSSHRSEEASAIATTSPAQPSETPTIQAKAEATPALETQTNQSKSAEENTSSPTTPTASPAPSASNLIASSGDQKAGQDDPEATVQRREDAAEGNAAIAPHSPQLGHPHPILLKPLGSGRSLLKNPDLLTSDNSQETLEEASENHSINHSINRSIIQPKQFHAEPVTDAPQEHPQWEQSASKTHPTIQSKHESSDSESSQSSAADPFNASQPLKNSSSPVSQIIETNPEDTTTTNSPFVQRQVLDSSDDTDEPKNQSSLIQRRTDSSQKPSRQSSSNKLPEAWSDISELLQNSSPIYPEADPVHYLTESLNSFSTTSENSEKSDSPDSGHSANTDADSTADNPSPPAAKTLSNNANQKNRKHPAPSPEALEQELERLVYPVYWLLQQQWQWERERQGYGSAGYPLWLSDGEWRARETPRNENRPVPDLVTPIPGSPLYGKLQTLSDHVHGLLRARWVVEREREGDRPIQFVR